MQVGKEMLELKYKHTRELVRFVYMNDPMFSKMTQNKTACMVEPFFKL